MGKMVTAIRYTTKRPEALAVWSEKIPFRELVPAHPLGAKGDTKGKRKKQPQWGKRHIVTFFAICAINMVMLLAVIRVVLTKAMSGSLNTSQFPLSALNIGCL